jgi:hypothetical protein
MPEILASLDDINANLPDGLDVNAVCVATDENTSIIQISVARVIRAYLTPVVSQEILYSWTVPTNTPDIIREIAAKLIGAQLYFNSAARTSLTVDQDNFAQKLYDQAMAMLQLILTGDIILDPDVPVTPFDVVTSDDFFPVDDTDRAFTMGMITP